MAADVTGFILKYFVNIFSFCDICKKKVGYHKKLFHFEKTTFHFEGFISAAAPDLLDLKLQI